MSLFTALRDGYYSRNPRRNRKSAAWLGKLNEKAARLERVRATPIILALENRQLLAASVTTDFAGSARIGDWVEAHVDVHKIGGRLAFANCYLVCNGERIVHASAVFARTGDRPSSSRA